MKEIGGYFEFETLIDNAYHKDVIELNLSRHALIYLIKAKKINKVYIPFYLCSSVKRALKQQGFAYEQYSISKTLMPLFDKVLNPDEYLYIVNYFGQLSNEKILKLKETHKNIIVDNVQAFFQRPIKGIDTFYSCRKFFGVSDGAYLSTDVKLDETLERDTSMHRMRHVTGRYEENAQTYYLDFKANDRSFREEPLKAMSRLTHNILGAINYESVFKTRNQNYDCLESALKDSNKMKLIKPVCAYGYPLYVENGIAFRKEMALNKIYIPTLWPDILNDCPENSIEYDFAANLLLLPCDQRYTLDDMAYMLQCLKKG